MDSDACKLTTNSLLNSTTNKSSDFMPVQPPNIAALFSPTVVNVKSSHGGGACPVTTGELH